MLLEEAFSEKYSKSCLTFIVSFVNLKVSCFYFLGEGLFRIQQWIVNFYLKFD